MNWFTTLITVIAGMNFLLMIVMVFLEKKKLQTITAWLTVLTFLPIFGFVLYVIFGSGLSLRTRRMIRKKSISEHDIIRNIEGMDNMGRAKLDGVTEEEKNLVTLCYNYGAYPCAGNGVKIYTDGKQKIEDLKKDLLAARTSINIEYYIFANDKTGKEIMDILCKKAREGVDVKFIYDSIGSRKTPRRFFKKLKKAGGKVCEFFPPLFHIRLINLKLNYRDHRKIVVIDGKYGWTGGINIRGDHLGLNKKLSPWRDTHIRIEGSGVYPLQNIFLDDYRYCTNDNTPPVMYLENGYFPSPRICGDALIQVIDSGPDVPVQKIKEAFVKMIVSAKKRVYIQTPYFIPDDVFFSALRLAAQSGVDVRVMAPKIPDKRTVYLATLSYLKEIVDCGVKVYLYEGFLHAKALIIDDNKVSIGTCNMDNRSFGLNFEDTAIIYSQKINEDYCKIFEDDMKKSIVADKEYFAKKRWLTKILQAIMRLLSPLF